MLRIIELIFFSFNITVKTKICLFLEDNKEDPTTFIDDIKQAAEAAQARQGFVYEPSSGLYYDQSTGYYYNAVSQKPLSHYTINL